MLEVTEIKVGSGKHVLLQDISFKSEMGKLYAIIGPNGAGKSTFLRAILGQHKLLAGSIQINGQSHTVKSLPREMLAFMAQDISLNVSLSAVEVVLLGRLANLGMYIDDHLIEEALHALEIVGLLKFANHSVDVLSGGQRQMVLFAQLLFRKSQLLLLDEPVSALDLKHQIRLLDVLSQQNRERQSVSLVVLHDLNLVAQYADEVLVIHNKSVVAQGAPESVMTADFISDVYGVSVDVSRGKDGYLRVAPMRGASQGTARFEQVVEKRVC